MWPRWMNSLNLNALIEAKFSFMRKIHFRVRTIVLLGMQCDHSNESLQEALDGFQGRSYFDYVHKPHRQAILITIDEQ